MGIVLASAARRLARSWVVQGLKHIVPAAGIGRERRAASV
jgi:hypothetical protein